MSGNPNGESAFIASSLWSHRRIAIGIRQETDVYFYQVQK